MDETTVFSLSSEQFMELMDKMQEMHDVVNALGYSLMSSLGVIVAAIVICWFWYWCFGGRT